MQIHLENICADYGVQITWNSFFYDTAKTFQQHCEDFDFSEDLFQVIIHREKNILLDIGVPNWLEPNACFVLYVIQNFDWEMPLKKVLTNDIQVLIQEMQWVLAEYAIRLKNA